MSRPPLEHYAASWRRFRALRHGLFAAAVAFLVAALLTLFALSETQALAAFFVAACLTWFLIRRGQQAITATTIVAHLNRTCPSLEESAALWLRPAADLSLPERLQFRRLEAAWAALRAPETFALPSPRPLYLPIVCALLCFTTLPTAWMFRMNAGEKKTTKPTPLAVSTPSKQPAPALIASTLTIAPPAYLKRAPRSLPGLDAEVEESATVEWLLTVSGLPTAVELEPAGQGKPLAAESLGKGHFRLRTQLSDTLVYRLAVVSADGRRTVWPQLHTLKVLRDQPPTLVWKEPLQARTLVEPSAKQQLIGLVTTDDHGIAQVELVITVAKGSGEGVKFRELRQPLHPTADGAHVGTTLNFAALEAEPGDEIYFHAEAADFRTPAPNRTRSETRFVVLRGPATEMSDPGVAMKGISHVPQYFRSQRQLIIDTEQLLAEKPKLTPEKFFARSEDIGVDQKLLRLRYGQFLGEELEADAAGAPAEAKAMAFAGRIRTGNTETAAQAAAVERAVEAQHQHTTPSAADRDGRPLTIEEIRAPFTHNHDNAEVATVFDQKVKASLRAVLSEMWAAEGLLRTGQPEAALPYENRALELLKELQQADRVYVRRIGFEPTPIKVDERRLRGELAAIPREARAAVPLAPANDDLAALRQALAALEARTTAPLPPGVTNSVAAQLARAAQRTPERFVPALELWESHPLELDEADRLRLRAALWTLLPAASERPSAIGDATPALGRKYFEALATPPRAAP